MAEGKFVHFPATLWEHFGWILGAPGLTVGSDWAPWIQIGVFAISFGASGSTTLIKTYTYKGFWSLRPPNLHKTLQLKGLGSLSPPSRNKTLQIQRIWSLRAPSPYKPLQMLIISLKALKRKKGCTNGGRILYVETNCTARTCLQEDKVKSIGPPKGFQKDFLGMQGFCCEGCKGISLVSE